MWVKRVQSNVLILAGNRMGLGSMVGIFFFPGAMSNSSYNCFREIYHPEITMFRIDSFLRGGCKKIYAKFSLTRV